jgi:DNA-binding protein YbaB
MTAETHPQVADAMQQMQRFQSVLEDQLTQLNTGSFTGTDENRTVEATLDGHSTLTGLFIEDGLLRLGTETVGQRINEAIAHAQAAASANLTAQQQQLYAGLSEITGSLKNGIGSL